MESRKIFEAIVYVYVLRTGIQWKALPKEYGSSSSIPGANRHDVTQVETVLQERIRKARGRTKQNLCAEAGYSGEKSEEIEVISKLIDRMI